MSDYKDQLLYTQEAMDTVKAQSFAAGKMEGLITGLDGNPDFSKIRDVAVFLKKVLDTYVLDKYGETFPTAATRQSAEFLDTALKMFIRNL